MPCLALASSRAGPVGVPGLHCLDIPEGTPLIEHSYRFGGALVGVVVGPGAEGDIDVVCALATAALPVAHTGAWRKYVAMVSRKIMMVMVCSVC